jgi:hypothetical protein
VRLWRVALWRAEEAAVYLRKVEAGRGERLGAMRELAEGYLVVRVWQAFLAGCAVMDFVDVAAPLRVLVNDKVRHGTPPILKFFSVLGPCYPETRLCAREAAAYCIRSTWRCVY